MYSKYSKTSIISELSTCDMKRRYKRYDIKDMILYHHIIDSLIDYIKSKEILKKRNQADIIKFLTIQSI